MSGQERSTLIRTEQLHASLLVLHLGRARSVDPSDEERLRGSATSVDRGTNLLVTLDDPSLLRDRSRSTALEPFLPVTIGSDGNEPGGRPDPAPERTAEIEARLEARPRAMERSAARLPVPGAWCTALDRHGEHCRTILGPPHRGAILVWLSADDDESIAFWTRTLSDRPSVAPLLESLERRTLEVARSLDRSTSFDRSTGADLASVCIEPADEKLAFEFQWRTERGGELVLLRAPLSCGGELVDIGRRVVREESFALPQASLADPSERELVLVRRTHPGDFGKVLRVSLDEEDLGPWHLGDGATPGHWYDDVLRIPYEVWHDRSSGRIRLEPEENREVQEARLRLFTERVVNGSWLSELEPFSVEGSAPSFDRTQDGEALRVGSQLALRGLSVRPPVRITYDIPEGYGWFEAGTGLGPDADPQARLRFEIAVDDERRFRSDALACFDPAMAARVSLDGPCRLILTCSADRASRGTAEGLWMEPVLWRAARPEART